MASRDPDAVRVLCDYLRERWPEELHDLLPGLHVGIGPAVEAVTRLWIAVGPSWVREIIEAAGLAPFHDVPIPPGCGLWTTGDRHRLVRPDGECTGGEWGTIAAALPPPESERPEVNIEMRGESISHVIRYAPNIRPVGRRRR